MKLENKTNKQNHFKCMKLSKIIAIGLAFSLFGGAVGYAAGEWSNIWVQFNGVNLNVNGKAVNTPNLLYNDTTYIPMRACAEMLGSTVGWDQNSNTASIVSNNSQGGEILPKSFRICKQQA